MSLAPAASSEEREDGTTLAGSRVQTGSDWKWGKDVGEGGQKVPTFTVR